MEWGPEDREEGGDTKKSPDGGDSFVALKRWRGRLGDASEREADRGPNVEGA
jgi:hypothetical protein